MENKTDTVWVNANAHTGSKTASSTVKSAFVQAAVMSLSGVFYI